MRRATMWASGTAAVLLLLSLPAATLAVFPGENGKIAFVSGRGSTDAESDVYILDFVGDASPAKLTSAAGQHRHPAWSPTLKHIAYALWATTEKEIWVHNVATNARTRLGPASPSVKEDRPSWSPDGTKIAYESEISPGSGQMDILVTTVKTGHTVNLTNTFQKIEGKPVWSPDGKWIYYSRRPLSGGTDDIYKEKSNNQGDPKPVVTSDADEYQAALSPNGKRLCFTQGPYGSSTAQVYVGMSDGSGIPQILSADNSVGAYNCAWSADGHYILYALGVYGTAKLVYEQSSGLGSYTEATPEDQSPSNFDGNPDWAPLHPPFCHGQRATIVGTDFSDVLRGTDHRDVIAAFNGNDAIKGFGGDDLVCAGGGIDDAYGGPGNDVLDGGAAYDLIDGGTGRDTCVKGPGGAELHHCEH